MKSWGDDLSMVSPFFALEAEEAVALELLDERVRLVLLVEFGL